MLALRGQTWYAHAMVPPAEKQDPKTEIPVTPSLEAWRAMTVEARERFVIEVNTILSNPPHFMGESVPHLRAKRRATDRLRKHFDAIGRVIYLGEKLGVKYPDEPAFTPDIFVVRDVAESEEDNRDAWIVADEGRGIDLTIEIVFEGDRKKDLVHNVERYARLGIPEYFVYDRKKQDLFGYRLPSPEARRYQRIIPQGGRHASAVLGLDLALLNDKLEFFYGMSQVFGSDDLIAHLQSMLDSLDAKAVKAEAKGLRDTLLAIAQARGLVCSEFEREKLHACQDPVILQRWMARTAIASSMAEVFADEMENNP